MNRAAMRDLVRRRIDEPTQDDFSDAQLDDLLNLSLNRVQTRIMTYDPSAFMAIDRKDITANQKFYQVPADFWHTYFIETKDPTTGAYAVIRPMSFTDTLVQIPGAQPVTDGLQRYARFGRNQFALFPVPVVNVGDGIQHTYCPHLTMADDNSVPGIPLALHMAIVLRAELLAMGETHDDMKNVIAELTALEGEIPAYYQRSGDIPDTLPLDLGKEMAYGYGGSYYWRIVGNGVDLR